MNFYNFKLFFIIFGFMTLSQTQAASLQKPAKTVAPIASLEKQQTPIEKALSQQRRERSENKLSTDKDQTKVFSTIKSNASQNFLATQNQHFSRIIQSLFSQEPS